MKIFFCISMAILAATTFAQSTRKFIEAYYVSCTESFPNPDGESDGKCLMVFDFKDIQGNIISVGELGLGKDRLQGMFVYDDKKELTEDEIWARKKDRTVKANVGKLYSLIYDERQWESKNGAQFCPILHDAREVSQAELDARNSEMEKRQIKEALWKSEADSLKQLQEEKMKLHEAEKKQREADKLQKRMKEDSLLIVKVNKVILAEKKYSQNVKCPNCPLETAKTYLNKFKNTDGWRTVSKAMSSGNSVCYITDKEAVAMFGHYKSKVIYVKVTKVNGKWVVKEVDSKGKGKGVTGDKWAEIQYDALSEKCHECDAKIEAVNKGLLK